MKKWINKQTIISFILGAIIFITIPVFAETRTINALYNNIRLKINGIFIETDVEPFIVNGRTMVPARFVAESLGATVRFNDDENCVDIVSNNESSGAYNNLKLQVFFMDEYRALGNLNSQITDFYNQILTSYFEHYLYKDKFNFDSITYDLNKIIKNHEAEVSYVNTLSKIDPLVTEKMNLILLYQSNVIDLYKTAFQRLEIFSMNKDFNEYELFVNSFTQSKENIDSASALINSEYENIFSAITK